MTAFPPRDELPDSYVDHMPCYPDLLELLGRVTWAAIRLHHGVRDAINAHQGTVSDDPFTPTLGKVVKDVCKLAQESGRHDQVQWVLEIGEPAVVRRNKVIHAVSFTAADGKQALGSLDEQGEHAMAAKNSAT